MAIITDPQLPPKAGYVEEEINGERVYVNAKTRVSLSEELRQKEALAKKEETAKKVESAKTQALSDRTEFLEDCIAEMATIVYGGV